MTGAKPIRASSRNNSPQNDRAHASRDELGTIRFSFARAPTTGPRHGAHPLDAEIEENTDIYSFLMHELGMSFGP